MEEAINYNEDFPQENKQDYQNSSPNMIVPFQLVLPENQPGVNGQTGLKVETAV